MNLKKGQSLRNKSYFYVAPLYRAFNEDLQKIVNLYLKSDSVLAWGVNDVVLDRIAGKNYDNHLFLLLDVGSLKKYINKSRVLNSTIESILGSMRIHEEYVSDYPYGDFVNSDLHIVVFSPSKEYNSVVKRFMKSEFSKMYTKDQLDKIVPKSNGKNKPNRVYRVLSKDPEYVPMFHQQLKEEFNDRDGTLPLPHGEFEYELPIRLKEEVFNSSVKSKIE